MKLENSIVVAAIILAAAVLLNGYFDRSSGAYADCKRVKAASLAPLHEEESDLESAVINSCRPFA